MRAHKKKTNLQYPLGTTKLIYLGKQVARKIESISKV